jgi:predicted enzyme related to lactoylglutathione lyase
MTGRSYHGYSQTMKVKRIVANIEAKKVSAAKRFYHGVLGLDILMDMGWIATFGSDTKMSVQISFMSDGGSGTPVPDISIEVDDVDDAFKRMKKARFKIEYPLTEEPWGVRRFYVRDPLGRLINILAHT